MVAGPRNAGLDPLGLDLGSINIAKVSKKAPSWQKYWHFCLQRTAENVKNGGRAVWRGLRREWCMPVGVSD